MASSTELEHPEQGAIVLEEVLFALSDPGRLDLVRQLRDGPMKAASCTALDPNLPKSTRSHTLKVLREAGVIYNVPEGRNRRLSLRRDDLDVRFPGLLDAVL